MLCVLSYEIYLISALFFQYCSGGGNTAGGNTTSAHTLAALAPHVRRHWLMALLVVLYKVG